MEFSGYQDRIFEWGETGRGNAFVDAVAGSGKTTTLVEVAHRLPKLMNARFLAFNKAIATEIQKRLVGTAFEASTIHSMGYGALRRGRRGLRMNPKKTLDIVKAVVEHAKMEREIGDEVVYGRESMMMIAESPIADIRKLSELYRLTLWEGEIADLAWNYGIHIHPALARFFELAVPVVVELAEQKAEREGEIDFVDMIHLPVKWGLKPYPVDFLLVDEAQDLSRCQLELVLSAGHARTRMLFVGDERQAIYGFSGAGTDSVSEIVRRTNAVRLPLSICYRCPSSHVALAKRIVPQIEPRPGADVGVVRSIDYWDVSNEVKSGDLVICRKTAPIVNLCFDLIRDGIGARVRGRDIGKGLVVMAKRILGRSGVRRDWDPEEFNERTDEYRRSEISDLIAKLGIDDPRVQSLEDKVACVRIIWNEGKCANLSGFEAAVKQLFAAQNGEVVSLSTVHKAKGLEAERVYIVEPQSMPLPARRDWQQIQEMNCLYVALTRAKSELVFVGGGITV